MQPAQAFYFLNLKSEVGAEVMDKLLSEADVFITNTRTKSLRKMGLDWETFARKISSFDHGSWAVTGRRVPKRTILGST